MIIIIIIIAASRPLRARRHVGVRVAAAVLPAPRAEPAGAPGARQGAAAIEVHEDLPAARALAGQDLLLHVAARPQDLPLLLLERVHAVQLGRQALLHLALQLLDLALLEQVDARLEVLAERGRGDAGGQVGVGEGAAVALRRVHGAEHVPLPAASLAERRCRAVLHVLVEAVAADEVADSARALQALGQPAARPAEVAALAGHHAARAGLVLAPRRDGVEEGVLQQLCRGGAARRVGRLELRHQRVALLREYIYIYIYT